MNPMIRNLVAVAFTVAAMSSAHAASHAEKRADTQYKAAMERCEPMKGNAQDVCEKDAKAAREQAKAGDKASRKGTPEARADAAYEENGERSQGLSMGRGAHLGAHGNAARARRRDDGPLTRSHTCSTAGLR